MNPKTILYVIVAGVISIALATFMYGYKTKYNNKLKWFLGFLRAISIFGILILLVNPKFKTQTYTVEKPKLSILVDNSASIKELKQHNNVKRLVEKFKSDVALNNKFEVQLYRFENDIETLDSLSFSGTNTNIDKSLRSVNQLFKNEIAPAILISDGNQTLGRDYEFLGASFSNPIYPIIAGDSIDHIDLKIEQFNTNKYSFLKNEFPVEAILVYTGEQSISTEFVITQGKSILYKKKVSFSKENNTQTISLSLPASKVGLVTYSAKINPLKEEKNIVNNQKLFAVEVIDQSTNVLIVSDIIHPDLGALKKAIETNEQRRVTFSKPDEAIALINDSQLVVLYQPTRAFKEVFSEIEKWKKNTWIITGVQTDWNFLNTVQSNFQKETTNQVENVSGILNINYGVYAVNDIGFDTYPPLKTSFGELYVNVPHESLLKQSIDGFITETPLFASSELNGKRNAILDGEGFWQWRAYSYRFNNSFEDFDLFVGKIIQYLASNKRRSRLEVTHESFYYNNSPLRISSQYFDKNFVFDSRAQLMIALTNTYDKKTTVFPMLLKNNFFEVDLNSLSEGDYDFTVSVKDKGISRSGKFTILDFNVEKQFLNANVTKLRKLAFNSGGKSFFIGQEQQLIEELINDQNTRPIQKIDKKVVPLIDWKFLLIIIVFVLFVEWFTRKYNGLI